MARKREYTKPTMTRHSLGALLGLDPDDRSGPSVWRYLPMGHAGLRAFRAAGGGISDPDWNALSREAGVITAEARRRRAASDSPSDRRRGDV